MLNSISWQQYVTAVILLSAAWYAYVGLRCYGPELSAFLKFKSQTAGAMPEVAAPHAVMGVTQPEAGTNSAGPDELVFGDTSPDDIGDATLPKGPADDLLTEAEALISAFADSADKTSFLSLLRILISKYEAFSDEISLPALITSLKTSAHHLSFTIQANEWPQTFVS